MTDLKGTIAVVTGASRGVGRGIAEGLGEAGATVYITGRSRAGQPTTDHVSGTIEETAAAVSQAGGVGISVHCDHTVDAQVEALFRRIQSEHGRLDLLVNNVWGGYEAIDAGWMKPFWQQPLIRWDKMFTAGVRAHFTASHFGVPLMLPQKKGLIVNISYWAGETYHANVPYGVSKAATNRLAQDMAHELRPHGIAAVVLYPGLVKTERVLADQEYFDMNNAESPQFVGRAIVALTADPQVMEKSGQILVAAQLALDYGFNDVNGFQPRPQTIEEFV